MNVHSWHRQAVTRINYHQHPESGCSHRLPDGILHLGEVIISYPQAVTQAEEHQHSVKREIAVLIIHGILHLLGYEHDKPELRQQMIAREKEILSYIEGRLE